MSDEEHNEHPLSAYMDMDPDRLDDDERFKNKTEMPEEAELNDIIKMALKVYVEMQNDIQYIAPKNRVRHLQVAERYLNQAKDAMYKKEQLLLEREKFEQSKKGKDDGSSSEGDEENQKFDRKTLLAEVSKERRG